MAMAKSTLDQLKIEAGKIPDRRPQTRWLPDEVEDLSGKTSARSRRSRCSRGE